MAWQDNNTLFNMYNKQQNTPEIGILNTGTLDSLANLQLGGGGNSNQDKPGFWKNLGNSFKNNDNTFDFGAIGDGVGSLASIFGAYNAMQQLGLNKDMFNLNKGITLDNHNNSIALAQQDLNDRARMRGIDSGYGTEAAQAAALGLPAPVSTPTLQNTFGGNMGGGGAAMQVNPNQPMGNMGAPTLQQLQQQSQTPYGTGYSQKGIIPNYGG